MSNYFLDLQHLLSLLPGYVFWKDVQSNFLGCNDNFANAAGLRFSKHIVGKNDFVVQYTMKDNFKYVLSDDQHVVKSGEPLLHIHETQIYIKDNNKEFPIITNKYPLINSHGEIIGIFGIYTPISEGAAGLDRLAIANQAVHKLSSDNEKRKKYLVEGKFGEISLSLREAQCINYILLGKTMKAVATMLQLSPRTVEGYIENIKLKIGCHSKSELFQFILNSNFYERFKQDL